MVYSRLIGNGSSDMPYQEVIGRCGSWWDCRGTFLISMNRNRNLGSFFSSFPFQFIRYSAIVLLRIPCYFALLAGIFISSVTELVEWHCQCVAGILAILSGDMIDRKSEECSILSNKYVGILQRNVHSHFIVLYL